MNMNEEIKINIYIFKYCDLEGRKINSTNSKTLVVCLVSRPSAVLATFDLPECIEPLEKEKEM